MKLSRENLKQGAVIQLQASLSSGCLRKVSYSPVYCVHSAFIFSCLLEAFVMGFFCQFSMEGQTQDLCAVEFSATQVVMRMLPVLGVSEPQVSQELETTVIMEVQDFGSSSNLAVSSRYYSCNILSSVFL